MFSRGWPRAPHLADDVEDAHDDLVQVPVLHHVGVGDQGPLQARPDPPLHLHVQLVGGGEQCQVPSNALENFKNDVM